MASQQQQPLPQGKSGIIFGPGRSTRLPDPGTREYQEMINRIRLIVEQPK